jgi:hypothetical protein
MSIDQTKAQLKDAFDKMIDQLKLARDAIDDPELLPAPPTERNLAEGYRYLIGFILGNIERALEDPMYPRFKRALQPMNRGTIDNADAVYLYAVIDGNYGYRVKGKALNSQHWRGKKPVQGRRAPQYVIFELASGFAGDSGNLMELIPGTRINTDSIDSHKIEVDSDGHFEILIAPERPDGYNGNFLLSKKVSHDKEHIGRYLVCRELFHDWKNEDLLDLEILRIDCQKTPKPVFDTPQAIDMMGTVGELTNNQMRFWNQFYTVLLESYGKTDFGLSEEGEGQFMPVNDMNKPNALGIATGGGQSTNIYSGGIFKLSQDEALIIESAVPVNPSFMGFHLSNLWGESLDFESYQSSLNRSQMDVGEDGIYRWIVSHQDPGFINWIDTTGLEEGFLTVRYTYDVPPAQENWPTLSVEKVRQHEIEAKLGAPMKKYDKKKREEDILIRHQHVQRRYRQY